MGCSQWLGRGNDRDQRLECRLAAVTKEVEIEVKVERWFSGKIIQCCIVHKVLQNLFG